MQEFRPLHTNEKRFALSTSLENSSKTLLINKLQVPQYIKIPVSMKFDEFKILVFVSLFSWNCPIMNTTTDRQTIIPQPTGCQLYYDQQSITLQPAGVKLYYDHPKLITPQPTGGQLYYDQPTVNYTTTNRWSIIQRPTGSQLHHNRQMVN